MMPGGNNRNQEWSRRLGLGAGCASLAIAIFVAIQVQSTAAELVDLAEGPKPSDEILERRLHALRTDLGEAQRRLGELAKLAREPQPLSTDADALAVREQLAKFVARLDRAELRLAELVQEEVSAEDATLSPAALEAAIRKSVDRALDPTLPIEVRVNAVQELRGKPVTSIAADYYLRVGQWLPGVADEELATTLARSLPANKDPGIQDWLLRQLAQAKDRRLREEAAESLGDSRADPRVRQALQAANRNDPSAAVREAAARSLAN